MTTKDILKNYHEYRNLVIYYDRKITSLLRMGHTPPGDLLPARVRYEHLVSAIECAIFNVTDPTEQLLLRLRYIEGWSWTKVSLTIHYSRSQTKRIHAKALAHLEQYGQWTVPDWIK